MIEYFEPRKRDFKIGCFHGKVIPEKPEDESTLRNGLFLKGSLILIRETKACKIRFIGYEVPTCEGKDSKKNIDLLGYDENYDLYLIELKRGLTSEKTNIATGKINRYYECLLKSLPSLQNEFRLEYHLPEFEFSGLIHCVILAHSIYYIKHKPSEFKENGISPYTFRYEKDDDILKNKCIRKSNYDDNIIIEPMLK